MKVYETKNGKMPYIEWLDSLDNVDAGKISMRIERLLIGNFSNCEPIGSGAHEVKMHFGPGYRVYFTTIDVQSILILSGGTKRTQDKDIKKAKEYLKAYIEYNKIGGKHVKK